MRLTVILPTARSALRQRPSTTNAANARTLRISGSPDASVGVQRGWIANTPFPLRFLACRGSGTGERRTACATPGYGAPCWASRRRSSRGSSSTRTSGVLVAQVRPARARGAGAGCVGGAARRYDPGEGRRRWRALDLGTVQAFAGGRRAAGVAAPSTAWWSAQCRGPGTAPGTPAPSTSTVAWLATQCSKTAVTELMRIAWRTVGAIITRVWADVDAAR